MKERTKSWLAGAALMLSAIVVIVALSEGVLTPTRGLSPDSPVTIRSNIPTKPDDAK